MTDETHGRAPRDNMAVDADGHPLAYGPEEVRAIVLKMIDEGEIMAVVVRAHSGDLAVQVFGPPSRDLLGALETATDAYRRVLKGHA